LKPEQQTKRKGQRHQSAPRALRKKRNEADSNTCRKQEGWKKNQGKMFRAYRKLTCIS